MFFFPFFFSTLPSHVVAVVHRHVHEHEGIVAVAGLATAIIFPRHHTRWLSVRVYQTQKRKKYKDGYIVVDDGRFTLHDEPGEGKTDGRVLDSGLHNLVQMIDTGAITLYTPLCRCPRGPHRRVEAG